MSVADRDPEEIMKEIDQARDQLAATVDSLAARANPQRIAEDAKARALAFVQKPAVTISLAGLGVLTVALVIRRLRNR
ncbi:membrane protein [Mycolicibacterium chitae]|nr:membrane protein [Mycolicibacterium chitae]